MFVAILCKDVKITEECEVTPLLIQLNDDYLFLTIFNEESKTETIKKVEVFVSTKSEETFNLEYKIFSGDNACTHFSFWMFERYKKYPTEENSIIKDENCEITYKITTIARVFLNQKHFLTAELRVKDFLD